jgi:hypothetical protein
MQYLFQDRVINKSIKIDIGIKELLLIRALRAISFIIYIVILSFLVSIPAEAGLISENTIMVIFIVVILPSMLFDRSMKYMSPIDLICKRLVMSVINSMFEDPYFADDLSEEDQRAIYKSFVRTHDVETAYAKSCINHILKKIKSYRVITR